jgi:2-dehydropantoate 2-reductase
MKALVYGGGAVGLGIASCLLKSRAHVDVVAREDTVVPLRLHGLRRTGLFGEYQAPPGTFRACSSLAELGGLSYDYILVCTKSTGTREAAADLSRRPDLRGPSTPLVLFQNGWGNAETFGEFFPKASIYNARVITGFSRPRKNAVTVTVHAEPIHIGSLFGFGVSPVLDLCRAIAEGGIPCEPTTAIEKDLWAKMLYNCALNPLGAVLGVPYGVLARHADTRAIMQAVAEEVFQVLEACGYRTHWAGAAGFLDAFYGRLVPSTAQHESSMLQDIRVGRRTEIDALNGAVVRLAAERGIPAACNRTLVHLVKSLEACGRPREDPGRGGGDQGAD